MVWEGSIDNHSPNPISTILKMLPRNEILEAIRSSNGFPWVPKLRKKKTGQQVCIYLCPVHIIHIQLLHRTFAISIPKMQSQKLEHHTCGISHAKPQASHTKTWAPMIHLYCASQSVYKDKANHQFCG